MAEALRRQAVLADVIALPALQLQHIDRYDIVCVLRPRTSRALDKLLKHCRRSGVHTVADVDDLIFDARYAALSPSVINQQASESSVRARFDEHLQALLSFDELIVSTEPLARHWRKQTGKHNVNVIANGLSARWLATPVKKPLSGNTTQRTITYLPGSSSHDKDFCEITEVLIEILDKHRDVHLRIVGTLNTDESLFPAGRISCSPWVDYFQLPHIIADSVVTLAPLVSSPFALAKSHIKFIESAAFGTPAICSPNEDICRHDSAGLNVAFDANDWSSALTNTLNNPLSLSCLESIQNDIRQTTSAEKSACTLLARWMCDDTAMRSQAA